MAQPTGPAEAATTATMPGSASGAPAPTFANTTSPTPPHADPTHNLQAAQAKPQDDRLLLAAQECDRKVQAFLARDPETPLIKTVQDQVRTATAVIEDVLRDKSPEQISLSYNGGKDCLVLLILILAVLPRRYRSEITDDGSVRTSFPHRLQSVYIVSSHPFAEVDEFVGRSVAEYGLELARFTDPMKQALEAYLAERPQVNAIFVGTRRTDPHGERLTHRDMTDPGWPKFERIHPVIDWHYVEIWAFIRELGVEYCELYDKGYTSLGGTTDTHPNPALERKDDKGETCFRPAYELMDDYEERLGRDK